MSEQLIESNTESNDDRAIATNLEQSATPDLLEYIQLHLNNETWAAIEMLRADTVISINAKSIVPIPNMPACFLGLFNHRGHVYWVIDLPALLNITPLEDAHHSYAAMMVTPQLEKVIPSTEQEQEQEQEQAANSESSGSRNGDDRANRSPLLLAVREIAGIVKFRPDQIQACIPPIPPGLHAYTKQCLDSDQHQLYILDIEAIANSPSLYVQ
ncbi:CheW protein [Thalassoporum mexicanum PCC 7367]|uniref:chemotaxis protein CheW n=1 Tax=Thalassoporum mexicanum TaxID=3457544 RepID=UPI00029FB98E|nr:chemotaxis protein CheW [Pseudanabaena sp. PCC 7367]AFY70678.1 CheW protein [Pseudanabaena sp. PCC 7367]